MISQKRLVQGHVTITLTSCTSQPRVVASSGSACRNCLKAIGRPCRAGRQMKRAN
jgi:hypothetical protein